MKKPYFFILSILLFSSLFASNNLIQNDCQNQNKHTDKVYINYNDLIFNENGIYLTNNNSYIPISDLSFDKTGYYTKKSSIKKKLSEDIEMLQCNECDTIYKPSVFNGFACPNCGSRDARQVDWKDK